MFKKIKKENMGKSDLGWLKSRFHFSFADYYNPNNMNFGALRVINDDKISPQTGFPKHAHKDMEIISYVVSGQITHKDSMGNEEILSEGEVQYMSAGTGITHSEYNMNKIEDLRLLQIWILPPKVGLIPIYGSYRFKKQEFKNKLLNIVSSHTGDAKIKIHQNVNFYASHLDEEKSLAFCLKRNKQVYFIQIEGKSLINNIELHDGDAMEITQELKFSIKALIKSHFLFIEM